MKFRLPRHKISLPLFWLLLSLAYGAVIISAELSMTPFSSFHALITLAAKWAALTAAASAVIGLISLNRWIFAFTWPVLSIASTIVVYFIRSIGVGLTPGVVELGMANGLPMWATLVSGKLIALILTALVISALIVCIRRHNVNPSRRSLITVGIVSAAIMTTALKSSPALRGAVTARLPYSLYHAFSGYLDMRSSVAEERTTYNGTPVAKAPDSPDVYVVIGESLRADHLPQNGYHRNTMPLMSRDSACVSYPDIYSDAFYTHASVPLLMTDTGPSSRDGAYSRQSFITLFKNAGYRSAWFANQDLSTSYAPFAHEADTLVYCNNVMSVYSYAKHLDTEIIPHIDRWLMTDTATQRLAVIHTIGSHWWYRSHYPESSDNFKPEVDSHDVGSLSREQIINSYDNTILETDRFLAALCSRLRNSDAVLLFISDHGENLGEDGLYFHASSGEAAHRPACLIWYSPAFARLHPEKADAIKKQRTVSANTDAIFHTVIDLASLSTEAYNPKRSLIHEKDPH